MTTASLEIAQRQQTVKAELTAVLHDTLDRLFHDGLTNGMADTERQVCREVRALGAKMLAEVLGVACLAACPPAAPGVVSRRRRDKDYRAPLLTTLGPISVHTAGRRDLWEGKTQTRSGSAQVLPLRGRCRASELLIEKATFLGVLLPYRDAERVLTYLLGEDVRVADNTIRSYVTRVGQLATMEWRYRSLEQVRQTLRDRATRDRNGRPILYLSTDASALARYDGDTTARRWRMVNGVRIWATDRFTGATLHLGGSHSWGDCEQVEAEFQRLIDVGLLPADGDYGDGLVAKIVMVADGQAWIWDRIAPLFPGCTQMVDVWHLLERLSEDSKAMFGDGTEAQRAWWAGARRAVLGPQRAKPKAGPRRGIPHRPRLTARGLPAGPCPGREAALELLNLVRSAKVSAARREGVAARDRLLAFLDVHRERVSYRAHRWRGYGVGSGAMESQHRSAVQGRMKRPGTCWCEEGSEPLFALRMVMAADRWGEFWSRRSACGSRRRCGAPHGSIVSPAMTRFAHRWPGDRSADHAP